ncbi:DUF6415 family natural product biosynthesis protein [Streptomyces sp. NPDC015032]|uniref:DUF6415 family natural product biosynthesis protein n=1 Tax=Streptomyces sp. NPDC015032 TaxID=3364937 RepID=UPI0036FC3F29
MTVTKPPAPTLVPAEVTPSDSISNGVCDEARPVRMARKTIHETRTNGAQAITLDAAETITMLLRGHIMELAPLFKLAAADELVDKRIATARELSGMGTPSDLSEARAHIDALAEATRNLLEMITPAGINGMERSGNDDGLTDLSTGGE